MRTFRLTAAAAACGALLVGTSSAGAAVSIWIVSVRGAERWPTASSTTVVSVCVPTPVTGTTEPDAPLPEAVASGAEPFLVVGAIAGG